MSENKRYYWLKLKADFFDDDTIQFIEEQENGVLYVNFYLKLCLKSLKYDGKLVRIVGNTLMPYDIKSLSKLTGTDVDTVRVAMELFKQIGLIEILESGEIYLLQINEMIGSETAVAERVRKHRLLKSNAKALQCNTTVTPMLQESNIEIEYRDKELNKEIDKEIEKDLSIPSDLDNPSVPTIELPLNDKSLYPIFEKNIDEWKELYPNVDILQELRKMKGWLNANPTKRKTKRGIARFINSWLSREQDKGHYNIPKKDRNSDFDEFDW